MTSVQVRALIGAGVSAVLIVAGLSALPSAAVAAPVEAAAPAGVTVPKGAAPLTHAQPRTAPVANLAGAPKVAANTAADAADPATVPSGQVVIPTKVPAGGKAVADPVLSAKRTSTLKASDPSAKEASAAGVPVVPPSTGAGTYPAPASITVWDSSNQPGYRVYGAGAYDAARNVDVEFGGGNNHDNGEYNGETWTWDGSGWTQHDPDHAPSRRGGASMAYDAATQTSILFGGTDDDSTPTFDETWSWNGTDWTQLHPTHTPPARILGSMAYDAALGKIVLFGGHGASGDLNDTWTWDGTDWTSVATPSGLTVRNSAGFAYDATAQDAVLYGGATGSTYFSDTWLYGAGGWVQATPTHAPGDRAGQGMAFDAVLGRVLFVGGDDASNSYNDQWLWDGTDWEEGAAPNYDGYRAYSLFVQAAGNGQIFIQGGDNQAGTVYDDQTIIDWGNLGTPKNATFETHAVDTRTTYGVNLANGNLVTSTTDLSVAGPGLGLTISRLENTQEGFENWVGYSSELTNGFDTWWGSLPDGSIVINGVRGMADMLYFHKVGSTFTSPPGADAILTTAGSGYALTMNSSSEVLTFNSSGRLISDADRNGNTIAFGWTSGKPSSITDTAGRSYTVTMGGGGDFIVAITDPSGRSIGYTPTYYGWLGAFTDGAGKTTYNDFGGPTSLNSHITDPVGNVTGFTYGSDGELATVVYPQTTPKTQTYTYAGATAGAGYVLQTKSKDPLSHTTTYQLNWAGQASKVTDALGHSRSSTYTANGDIATSVDAIGAGNTTTTGYDALNNPTSVSLPTGATSNAYYTSGPNCSTTDTGHPYLAKCTTDTQGNQNTVSYDGPGNLTQQKNTTTGATKSFTYNPATPTCGGKVGQLCSSTDGNSHTTSYAYDSAGNLTTVTPPAPLGATTQTFDGLGRVATMTDGKGQKTTYSYDGDDRITRELTGGATTCTYSAGTCLSFGYDDNGNLTTQHDVTGTTSYTFDGLNRQKVKTLPGGATLTQTYDAGGNVATYADAGGTVTYGYNAANQLTSLAEPGGSCSGTVSLCTTFVNDNNGNRTSTTYPGGTVMATTLDNSARATEVKATNGATTFTDYRYSYTSGSTDKGVVQTRTDTAGLVTSYGYDARNELLTAVEKNGATTTAAWTYCYDPAGNRTGLSTATSAGASCTTGPATSYSYNAANELTALNGSSTGWSYDANGNETAGNSTTPRTAETYTATNQLSSITTGGTATAMTYAGSLNDERVTAGPIAYQNGPEGITNQTSSGSATDFTRDPNGTLVSERIGSAHYYYLFDNQTTVLGLVNGSGTQVASYSYDPYGVARTATSSVTNPFRYVSGITDTTTGLTKFGARYYDPNLGRFTQQDPSRQESNAYAYVGCNPINATDSTGRLTDSQVCGLVTGAVGLIAVAAVALAFTGVGLALEISLAVAGEFAAGATGAGAVVFSALIC